MNVQDLVFAAIEAVNQQIADSGSGAIPLDKSVELILMGENSAIDSLTLVNLIVAVEEQVADATGQMLTLVDEDIFSSDDQPLESVGSLIQMVESRLQNG